jgi:hypothetical protein
LEDKEKKSETTESDIKPKSLKTFDPIFKEKEKQSKKEDKEETSSHDSQRLEVKSKPSKGIDNNKKKEQKEAKQSSSKSKSKSSTSKQDVNQDTILTQSDDLRSEGERSENIIPVTIEIQPPAEVYFIINNFENFKN